MARFFTTCLYFASLLALAGCASTATQESLTSTAFSQTNMATNDTVSTIKILGTLPPGLTLETRPGEYVTDYETVISEEAWAEIVLTPSEYEWVEGEVKGVETTVVPRPPWSETVTDKYIFQEATTELSTRPALYVKNGTVVESAEVIEQVIPAITKEYKRGIWKTAGPAHERVTPYEFKDGKTRVPIKTFPPKEKIHPAITQQIAKRKLISPQTYIIKDETGQIIHRFKTRDELKAFLE